MKSGYILAIIFLSSLTLSHEFHSTKAERRDSLAQGRSGRPGNAASKTKLKKADPHMRFKHISKVRMSQGNAHLRIEFPLVRASCAAVQGHGSILLLADQAQEFSRRTLLAGIRYETWQQHIKEANASLQTILDINAAAGTRGILLEAIKCGADPFSDDFERDLIEKLPASVLDELEHSGKDLSQYEHIRAKGHNGRYLDLAHNSATDTQVLERHNRQVIAAVVGLLAGGLAVYNTYQIYQINGELSKAAKERKIIAHSVSELATRTKVLADTMNRVIDRQTIEQGRNAHMNLAQAILIDLQTLSLHLNSVVNQALSQRLDASLVQEEVWDEEILTVRRLAQTHGNFDLAYTSPVEIVAQKAAVHMGWSGSLSFILPIPLHSRAQDMDMWEFQQLPIKTSEGWAEVSVSTPYLLTLTSPSTVFVDYSQAQF